MAQEASGDIMLVRGPVELGDQRGRTLGFPTANLAIDRSPDGVWAGWVWRGEHEVYAAAISVGNRPTFYGDRGYHLLEAHMLDFDGDLYGEVVTVVLCSHLRDQVKFESVQQLIDQLHADVDSVRGWSERTLRPMAAPGVLPLSPPHGQVVGWKP